MSESDNISHNILLGVTGSVATIKLNEIVQELERKAEKKKIKINIKTVATQAALNFVSKDWELQIMTDNDEWTAWKGRGDLVQHIELRKWADIFIIAPLDANTLAKIANGLCDNLLTCICRAWDFQKPFLVYPAMNTFMFKHDLTQKHINEVEGFGVIVISPVSKKLMCGDTGEGGLHSSEDIARVAIETVIDYKKKKKQS